MKLSVIGDFATHWGEAPLWISDRLYFVDIHGKSLMNCREDGSELRVIHTAFQPSTIVPVRGGRGFLCAGEGGIYTWDGEEKPVSLMNPEPDIPANRMNEGKCSPDGRFFVGSINADRCPEASLYRLDPDMSFHKVLDGVTNSNGIVWTKDGKEVFYIDTKTRSVSLFDYEDGRLSNRREAFSTARYDASPDGMTIDSDGHLWIAMCHGGCVVCFNREGEVLRQIDFPCREVTSCCFGGEKRDLLFVTTGRPKDHVEPLAGKLFMVRGLEVQGLPAYDFLS